MNDDYANAVAGPSSPRPDSAPPAPHAQSPPLFLPPAAPPQPTSHLSSTQNLLARFRLLPAYDKYVRPFAAPADPQPDPSCAVVPSIPSSTGAMDKGKGRELASAAQTQTPGGVDGDDDEAGAKGEKKWRNSYKHLIKGIPGKHSLKKDDYLSTMMQVPPKQRIPVVPFDSRTQRDAFSVSLEGLKGWNTGALLLESAQAREDRKKRNELKRLAKAQAYAAQSQTQASPITAPPVAQVQHASQPQIQAPIPTTSASLPPTRPQATTAATPRTASGTPRPTSTVPRPGSAVPRPGSTSAVPRPGSAVPRPGSAKPIPPPIQPHQDVQPRERVATPLRTNTSTPTGTNLGVGGVAGADKRGKKRERDDSALGGGANTGGNGNHSAMNGTANGGTNRPSSYAAPITAVTVPGPKAVINAKAGMAGIRPRPIKKQRMDAQGQSRDITSAPVQQQPTPQGV